MRYSEYEPSINFSGYWECAMSPPPPPQTCLSASDYLSNVSLCFHFLHHQCYHKWYQVSVWGVRRFPGFLSNQADRNFCVCTGTAGGPVTPFSGRNCSKSAPRQPGNGKWWNCSKTIMIPIKKNERVSLPKSEFLIIGGARRTGSAPDFLCFLATSGLTRSSGLNSWLVPVRLVSALLTFLNLVPLLLQPYADLHTPGSYLECCRCIQSVNSPLH